MLIEVNTTLLKMLGTSICALEYAADHLEQTPEAKKNNVVGAMVRERVEEYRQTRAVVGDFIARATVQMSGD